MDAARQAWVETAHCAHDVDAFELIRAVLFEDGRVLDRIFVRSRRTVDIARTAVPWRGWIRMIIGDFAVADDEVMRQHTANGFMKSATDGFIGDGKRLECLRA